MYYDKFVQKHHAFNTNVTSFFLKIPVTLN